MTLPNALCEVLLLVGIDEKVLSTCSVSVDLKDVNLKPKVLSAISGDTAMNFIPVAHKVDSYPPGKPLDNNVDKKAEKVRKDSYDGNKISRKRRIEPSARKKRLDRMMRLVHSRLGANDTENPDLPISYDVLHSIPSYCFPDGFKVSSEKSEISTNSFAFKDECSQYHYVTYLIFSRLYIVEKDDSDNLYFTLDMTGGETFDGDKKRCYIPQCCVIISKFPYRTVLKECLSCVIPHIDKTPEDMTAFMKEFAYIITHIPVPPPGNLGVNFRLYNLNVTLMPPTHPDKPVIDLELHLVFLCFNAEEFLKILSCVLLEERIVFLSTNYDLLTMIMESVMHLILPFKWRFAYSTVLPTENINYLESSGKFLYGVHSSHKEKVEQMTDLVVVDIDMGNISLTPRGKKDSVHAKSKGSKRQPSLPAIPSEIAKVFISKMTQINRTFAITGTLRQCSSKDTKEHKDKMKTRTPDHNRCISNLCLKLMVDLFSDVMPKLNIYHRYFDKNSFLEEHFSDRDFYEKIFQTEMFKEFVEERMKEDTDYWSEIETRIRQARHLSSMDPSREQNKAYALSQDETIDVEGQDGKIKVIDLKDFTLENHNENILIQISNALECSCDGDERASLYFIRGSLYCAHNEKMAALQDFIDMSTTNVRILPVKIISDLYMRLTGEEESLFMGLPGHEVLLYYIKVLTHRDKGLKKIRMNPLVLPDSDLDYLHFEEIISSKHISNDYNTIRDLFDNLSVGTSSLCSGESVQTKVVQPMTLKLLTGWLEYHQIQCKKVKLEKNILQDDETVLKISKLVQTDFGHGLLGLTNKRLFFLNVISNEYQEITKLSNIIDIDKVERNGVLYGVLNGAQALTLISKEGERNSRFTAYLNEERNWWYMVIREMWAGKVVADAMKDVMMVQHAKQNTLLIDAIFASGQDHRTAHFMKSEAVSDKLSYFYNLYHDGKHLLPNETKDALQLKIDVNFAEPEKRTVYSLLYTGGEENTSEPKLWCGLRDGTIKVFSAVTWTLERVVIVEPRIACVACLTQIDDSQVWVGSFGIHIIEVQSLICTRTLLAHADQVVDIVLANDKRFVYTASIEGTIIKWNLQNLFKEKKKINLTNPIISIKICKEHLICGGLSSLLICDLNGTLLRTATLKEDDDLLEISCFLVLENGVVWAGTKHDGKIHIFDISTGQLKHEISIINCQGIRSIDVFDDMVWVGTKEGKIYIYSTESYNIYKQLEGHDDAVKVLYNIRTSKGVLHSYMISGGSSRDGRVCIWNAMTETFED